ncbi:MAG: hypothetical protein XD52_0173 [bacterium 42_11]|nr:MAG: hypothetical protein XD52_0173 [bacterium 42_11]
MDIGEFSSRVGELKKAKGMAIILLQYYELLANQFGVQHYPSVRSALAKFRFESESALTAEETLSAVLYYGSLVYETIMREARNYHLNEILKIISSDPNVKNFKGTAEIVIQGTGSGNKVLLEDEKKLLSMESVRKIEENPFFRGAYSSLRIEIDNGNPIIVNEDLLMQKINKLKAELATLRNRLETIASLAGFAPLEGEGIIIRIYDAEKKEGESNIIHDSDLRDVVNELFAAGALGVQIGQERVVTHTSIRCVGPVILVNHRPIPVDPVVIRAVGDPEVLASALELIERSLGLFGIRIEVKKEERVRLVGYRN